MNYNIYNPIRYFFKETIFEMQSETIFVALAFVAFIYWIIIEMKKESLKMEPKDLFWFLFSAIFGSLTGGRLWYYIENWQGLKTIITLFNLSVAGLTSYGMIFGGIMGIILFIHSYNKKNNIEKDWRILFGKYIDIIAVASALFIFIYRMGCFHYGCVPGTPTELPWGMFAVNYGKYSGIIMHPTALYLSFSALLIFLFLNWYKKRKKFDGEIGLLFIIIYSFNRFWIEFLRAGTTNYFGLSSGQWVTILFLLISIIWWSILHSILRKKKEENAN